MCQNRAEKQRAQNEVLRAVQGIVFVVPVQFDTILKNPIAENIIIAGLSIQILTMKK
jgi:hypothetical protein